MMLKINRTKKLKRSDSIEPKKKKGVKGTFFFKWFSMNFSFYLDFRKTQLLLFPLSPLPEGIAISSKFK